MGEIFTYFYTFDVFLRDRWLDREKISSHVARKLQKLVNKADTVLYNILRKKRDSNLLQRTFHHER